VALVGTASYRDGTMGSDTAPAGQVDAAVPRA